MEGRLGELTTEMQIVRSDLKELLAVETSYKEKQASLNQTLQEQILVRNRTQAKIDKLAKKTLDVRKVISDKETAAFQSFCDDNGYGSIQDFTGPDVDEVKRIFTEKDALNRHLRKAKKEFNKISIDEMEDHLRTETVIITDRQVLADQLEENSLFKLEKDLKTDEKQYVAVKKKLRKLQERIIKT